MSSDKISSDEILNPIEAQEDAEYICITDDNKEDVMEFAYLYLEGISKEISAQQSSKISLGKMLVAYDDRKLKAQGKSLLLESTQLARRYKEIKKALARLDGEMTLTEVSVLFRNIDQFLTR